MQNRYLSKHATKFILNQDPPDSDLAIVVVIPCYDERNLDHCLNSIISASKPDHVSIEILVLVNYPESASTTIKESSKQLIDAFDKYKDQNTSKFKVDVHLAIFPDHQAGVGLARKTGMDEAVRKFHRLGRDGIIVNLDADCLVAVNYFLALWEFFSCRPKIWAAGIHFEHRLDEELSEQHLNAIIEYELHLRYFIQAQRQVGLPFGFQTIGSCMAVRSSAYQQMGGMNIRQAGEDFYFLHKFISIGRFAEINSTTVYPSARASERVPFGTGRAISTYLLQGSQKTYAWPAFAEVQTMVERLPDLYTGSDINRWIDMLPSTIRGYFHDHDFAKKLQEIKKETSRYDTFMKRFYQWFNAFRLMKYLHFGRSTYPDRPVITQSLELLQKIKPGFKFESEQQLLNAYREVARNCQS